MVAWMARKNSREEPYGSDQHGYPPYHFLFTILISLLLLREIIKSEDPQEVVLYSIILIPFILRSLHLK